MHHLHIPANHRVVISLLHQLATESNTPYSEIQNKFALGTDILITQQFWALMQEQFPGHEVLKVSYCPTCDAFDLE
jgi:hypothetical protein